MSWEAYLKKPNRLTRTRELVKLPKIQVQKSMTLINFMLQFSDLPKGKYVVIMSLHKKPTKLS